MSNQTRLLSKLLGLYCIIIAVAMVIHQKATLETITALVHDRPAMFVVGVITVLAGLAMVLVHNIWSGGAAQVIVTLVGWVTLIKGSLFLLLSPVAAVDFYLGTLHYAQLFYMYAAFSLVLGVYLVYAGFRATPR
jgi:vacuolar-type H+-ATPase subunit I/STV1